jgi:hypothetical protein
MEVWWTDIQHCLTTSDPSLALTLTVVNVSGDTIVAATIAHVVKLEGNDDTFKLADSTRHVPSDEGSDDVEEISNVDGVPALKKMPDFSV